MRNIFVFGLLLVGGVVLWHAVGKLDGEAVAMAIGVLFGILAGVPMAIVVLSAERSLSVEARPQPCQRVVVIDGLIDLGEGREVEVTKVDARQWKVVGESEYWME